MNDYLIYPKQFQRAMIPVEKNRCFVIMPFKSELDLVYGTIKRGLNQTGYICNRVDEVPGSTPIINKILTEILRSRYIIADLTDCNPNVFYELGIAHSFKDASNIIILKQSGSKVPFDVTHLTYIEYEVDNPRYLTAEILRNITRYSYLADFQDALNLRGVIPFVKENGEYFIDYLKAELGDSLSLLTRILLDEIAHITNDELTRFLDIYERVISKCFAENYDDILSGVLKVYQEVLILSSHIPCAQEHVACFLDGTFLARFNLKDETILSLETDLAIALANSQKMFSIVLPWIIQYFSQTKSATIDLNRYKLEAFLMTSEHPTVNEMICNAVFDRNCYIREHMSDIIGEKRIVAGVQNLCQQLHSEENYFSAVSMIEALGKLNNTAALPYILDWIAANETNILLEKQFFVLKHARIAIAKLDSLQGQSLKDFDAKYNTYLENYYIL